MSLSSKLDLFLNRTSFFLFGHGLTPSMGAFLGNVSWSFFGGLFAAGILFATNILAGRILSVEEYGRYNATFVLAQILLVVFLGGMDLSVIRALAEKGREIERSRNISATLFFVSILIIIAVSVFWLLRNEVVKFFHVDTKIILAACALAVSLALRQVLDSIIRGLGWFKQQAVTRLLEASAVFSIFLIIYKVFQKASFLSYISSLTIGSIFLISLYLFFIRRYVSSFSFAHLVALISYGKIVFVAGLLGAMFGALDRLAIAKYLSLYDLGVYSVYYTASFIVVTQIGSLFDNVFFPTVVKFKDDLKLLVDKVDKLSLWFLIPFFVMMSVIIFSVVKLFGEKYPMNWFYVFGFALVGTLKMILIVNTSLITAFSTTSLKLGIIFGNLTNLLFIIIFFLYLHFYSLSILTMVVFLIFYTFTFIVLNKWILYKVGVY